MVENSRVLLSLIIERKRKQSNICIKILREAWGKISLVAQSEANCHFS